VLFTDQRMEKKHNENEKTNTKSTPKKISN